MSRKHATRASPVAFQLKCDRCSAVEGECKADRRGLNHLVAGASTRRKISRGKDGNLTLQHSGDAQLAVSVSSVIFVLESSVNSGPRFLDTCLQEAAGERGHRKLEQF
mmetsp:Transcript_30576/g.65879  ORF Transcript_30576/g.65879 Transcript_30576/m.65879 type:complete len:108 (+) Transcript_30576:974-1297(+)